MKRLLFICATLAAMTFVSCEKENKDDPKTDYPYSFYEPCMIWGSTMDEVKQFMDGTYSSWKLDQSDSSEKDLLYIDGKYKTINMSYTFKDGKLESCYLAYPFRSDSFDKLKSDLESRYHVEMKWQGVYSGIDLYSAHSDVMNMDISLTNSDSDDMLHTIAVDFTGTGPAPSDKIKLEVTPSNKATLNYTDLISILLTFPEAKEVSYYDDFFKTESFSLVDSQGSTIWEIQPASRQVFFLGNEIRIDVPISMYDKLTKEGDYTFVITPNTILVDGRMLLEQRITYHLTAIHPVIEPFKLKFDGKVTNTDELHFYIPDDIEVCGWSFCGGTVIYDEDNNESGKVYNFSQVEDNHFYLILKMTATDATKRYHFDVDEGLIKGRTPLADIPSAAATVYFQL